MTKIKLSNSLLATAMKKIAKPIAVAALVLPLMATVEVTLIEGQQAVAQQEGQSKRRANRIQSIRQKHIKTFEKIQEAFTAEDDAQIARLLDKLQAEPDLNNIEKFYVHQFRGNINFNADNFNGALREFKKAVATPEGIPTGTYNQVLYTIAQVYFSVENYREALSYAQRWFKTQEDPSADAYMLIGQAQYLLKRYDDSLPNVKKGIDKYVQLGSVPKEGWLNLLSSIYRQKNQYKKMLPVVKQLVKHYPKKTYLLTMGGIYNELNDQARMTAIYQALYDQNLITSESEMVTLASLQLSQDNPYKASTIMDKGLKDGVLKKNLKNYRIYSQALYLAREYESALSPLAKAAGLAKDGKLYNQLGQSYIALNRWKEAESAIKKALNKGKLQNRGQTLISLGLVQFEQKKFESAKSSFKQASKIEKVASAANNWIKYVDAEVYRLAELKKPIEAINTDVEPAST